MERELAEKIIEALENEGEDCELREGKSGDTGVVCNNVTTAINAIVRNAHLFVDDEMYSLFDNADIHIDTMGLSAVIY